MNFRAWLKSTETLVAAGSSNDIPPNTLEDAGGNRISPRPSTSGRMGDQVVRSKSSTATTSVRNRSG